jgi:hypothetical protein
VVSNTSWTVTSDQSWCTPTTSGTGNGTIYANYASNTSSAQRIANLTVLVSGLSPVVVTVTQTALVPTLAVTPHNQNVGFTAGSTSFSVESNTSWTVTCDQSWCLVTPSGTGTGSIQANYAGNSGLSPRIATVTVTVPGLSPVNVTVTQDGFVGIQELSNDEITLVPNPSDGSFSINTKHLNGETLVVNIYDNTGRFIQSGAYRGSKSYQFDFTTKPKGEYMVRVSVEGKTIMKKLILK